MKKIIILSFAIIFLSGSIAAQELAIGPLVGYNKGEDIKTNYTLSIAARFSILSFGIEGSVGYKTQKYEGDIMETKTYPVMVTGLLYLLPIAYLQAGAGWYHTKLDFNKLLNTAGVNDETKTEFGYHAGAGVELPLGSIILTGDIKYVLLDLKLDSIIGLRNVKSNHYMINAGLLFKIF